MNKTNRPPADLFPSEGENPTGPLVPSGTPPVCANLTFAAGVTPTTMTNQISGQSDPFPRSLWFDASSCKMVRLVIDDVKTIGASTSRLILKYALDAADAIAGTFSDAGIGASEVSVSMAALGPSRTAFPIQLDDAAANDVLFHVFAIGGDGTADPIVSGVHAQFFAGVLNPCSDGGCPMPVGIYNGEDFSTYADEADFLNTAENELKNLYCVWYGTSGDVTFDPDLSFCGNPVVVGRWVATAEGVNFWDKIGWASYSRFANPLIDDGGSSGGQLVAFRSVWTTLRMKIEDGWNADTGYGFTVSDVIFGGNGITGEALILLRDGRVIFHYGRTGISDVEYDIGPASLLVGTTDFVELTIHAVMTDLGGGIWQVQAEVFINPACSGGSAGEINTATPLQTHTDSTIVPTPIGGTVNNFKFYDWDKFNYTPDNAQWPEKKIWVAQAFYSGSLT